MPSITVFIPVFNNYHTLDKRMSSVIDQSVNINQLVIINDCSTDESWEFLSNYEFPKSLNYKLINSSENSGSPFGHWNNAFKLAIGDFIWIAEADDFCNSTFLEKVTKAFEDPEVVVSHCRSFDYRSNTNIRKNQWWDSFGKDIWESDFVEEGRALLEKYGRFKCPVINVSSAVFRKSVLDGIEIPSSYKYCGDWWFWAQIFLKGKVSYIAEPLNYFRKHEASATSFYNINLAKFSFEATIIAKKINLLCDTNFKYNINYSWLVDFWFRGLLINKNFNVWKNFLFLAHISFQWRIYKEIIVHYLKKVLQ